MFYKREIPVLKQLAVSMGPATEGHYKECGWVVELVEALDQESFQTSELIHCPV